MKRILLIANDYTTILDFRMELIRGLINNTYEVFVALPEDDHNDEIAASGCKIIILEMSRQGTNPIQDLKTLIQIKRIVQKIKPDVVLTFTVKPNVYGGYICGKNRIPYIANITGLGNAVENGGILQKITLGLYRIGLKKAHKVFFQNTANRDYMLERGVLKGNYDLLPGSGVNLEKNAFEEYPCDDKLKFLYVGRIMRDKGIVEFLDAAEYIKNRYPSTSFMIVGPYEELTYKERMEKLQKGGVIDYYGFQSNVHPYMKECNAIIQPSYHEGLSNVLLEAAACGRPILASNIPGCKETFEEGISGLGFEIRSSRSLIETIERFIKLSSDERKMMGERGRKRVEKEFSRELVVEKYLNVIEETSN